MELTNRSLSSVARIAVLGRALTLIHVLERMHIPGDVFFVWLSPRPSKTPKTARHRDRASRVAHAQLLRPSASAPLISARNNKNGQRRQRREPTFRRRSKRSIEIGREEWQRRAARAHKRVARRRDLSESTTRTRTGSLSSSELATFAEESGTGSSISQEERKQLGLFFEVRLFLAARRKRALSRCTS